MGSFVRQVRYAIRSLRNAPAVTGAVVLALAVGMGVGIPVLGTARAATLRSGHYTDPLLRDGARATDWLPGVTADRVTVPEIQDAALRALFGVLLALALLLLAVALVNAVTLILARAAARRPEAALRTALGAGPRRLVGQLFTEGAVLLAVGGGLGLLVGAGAGALLRRSWPGEAPPWGGTPAGGWSLAAAGVLLLAPLLAWHAPAGVAWRRDLPRLLSTGGRATAGRGERRTRQALAVALVAASTVLLTGAGLLLRGFALPGAESTGPGFDPRDTLAVQVRLPGTDGLRERQLQYAEMGRRIAALPGVADVGVATPGTWLGLGTTDRVTAICLECEMYPALRPTSSAPARIHAVGPGSFGALGAQVLQGREFAPGDVAGAPRVAVVNATFAARLFPSRLPVDPLGKRIRVGGREGEWYTVVGVVGDVRAPAIGSGSVPVPAVYLSAFQHPPSVVSLAVRATGDPMGLLPAVEEVVRAVAPGATLADGTTLERYLARFRAPLGWFAAVLGALAGVALLLAASGLHGVMAYDASRRTREIGIRMALGAGTGDVTRMVLGEGLRITCVGAVASLFGALALGRLLHLLLAGVEPFDPLLFGGICGLLGGVALLGSHRPARRAASVDPLVAFRTE